MTDNNESKHSMEFNCNYDHSSAVPLPLKSRWMSLRPVRPGDYPLLFEIPVSDHRDIHLIRLPVVSQRLARVGLQVAGPGSAGIPVSRAGGAAPSLVSGWRQAAGSVQDRGDCEFEHSIEHESSAL